MGNARHSTANNILTMKRNREKLKRDAEQNEAELKLFRDVLTGKIKQRPLTREFKEMVDNYG